MIAFLLGLILGTAAAQTCRPEDTAFITGCLQPMIELSQSLSQRNPRINVLTYPLFYFPPRDILNICETWLDLNRHCLTPDLKQLCPRHGLYDILEPLFGFSCDEVTGHRFFGQYECLHNIIGSMDSCTQFIRAPANPNIPRNRCESMPNYFACVKSAVERQCGVEALDVLTQTIQYYGCPLANTAPDTVEPPRQQSVGPTIIGPVTTAEQPVPTAATAQQQPEVTETGQPQTNPTEPPHPVPAVTPAEVEPAQTVENQTNPVTQPRPTVTVINRSTPTIVAVEQTANATPRGPRPTIPTTKVTNAETQPTPETDNQATAAVMSSVEEFLTAEAVDTSVMEESREMRNKTEMAHEMQDSADSNTTRARIANPTVRTRATTTHARTTSATATSKQTVSTTASEQPTSTSSRKPPATEFDENQVVKDLIKAQKPLETVSDECNEQLRTQSHACLAPLMDLWHNHTEFNPVLKELILGILVMHREQVLNLCDHYASSFLDCELDTFYACREDAIVRFADSQFGYACGNAPAFFRKFDCLSVLSRDSVTCRKHLKFDSTKSRAGVCRDLTDFYFCIKPEIEILCAGHTIDILHEAIVYYGCEELGKLQS